MMTIKDTIRELKKYCHEHQCETCPAADILPDIQQCVVAMALYGIDED